MSPPDGWRARMNTPVKSVPFKPILNQDTVIVRIPPLFHEIESRIYHPIVRVTMTGADTTGVENAPDCLAVRRAVGHEGTCGYLIKNPLGDDVRQSDLPILPEHKLNSLDISVLGGRDYKRIRRVRRPRSTGTQGGNPVSAAVEDARFEHPGIGERLLLTGCEGTAA